MKLPNIRDYPKEITLNQETYKVRFVRQFEDKKQLGICDPSEREIVIRMGLGKKETFKTFIHEVLHLLEFEGPVTLHHKTIYKLEEAIFSLLIENF